MDLICAQSQGSHRLRHPPNPKILPYKLSCWIQNRALASLQQDAVVATRQLLFLSMDTHGLLRFLSAHRGETKITRMIDTSDVFTLALCNILFPPY